MKNTFLLVAVLALVSCKDTKKVTTNYSAEHLDVTTSLYPENITKVFEAHGGIDAWNEMNTLAFTMKKPDGDEITTTDLKTRKALIEMAMHTIGFDGKNVWLNSKDEAPYKGKPKFYYNLMFYFYTMPFVLGDEGITYKEVKPLIFEGKEYPGIQISYEAGVGESSDDEYILYYDSETHQMTWLSYTMTYFAKEKSKKFNYIKYNTWQEVNGFSLPESIQWFNVVDGNVMDMKNEVLFSNVSVSKDKLNASFFEVPEGAKVVE